MASQIPWNKDLKGMYHASEATKAKHRARCQKLLSTGWRPNPKVEPLQKTCPVCGRTFLLGGRGRRPYKSLFCSVVCARQARFHKGAVCKTLTDTNAAYLAGFVDGEGSVLIIHRKPDSYYIGLRIAQSMKAKQVLDWISEVTGIGASINKHPTEGINHDMGLTWACSGEAAISLIAQLKPYLIVKERQASLAIDFQEWLRQLGLKGDRRWQKEYKEQMGILNKRGKQVTISFTSGG